jgi:hypothetical protein
LILKKEKGIAGVPAKKVSWNFRDVLGIYAKAYFLPLALSFLVFAIALVCGFDLSGFFFGSIYVLPLFIGVLSLAIYWFISKRRFEVKFSQAYPDIKQEAIERPASVITLTLWQLLYVGMINIVFSVIAYGAIMVMLAKGSL